MIIDSNLTIMKPKHQGNIIPTRKMSLIPEGYWSRDYTKAVKIYRDLICRRNQK